MSRDHWNDIPGYPVSDWQAEVASNDTRLGYGDWAENQYDMGVGPRLETIDNFMEEFDRVHKHQHTNTMGNICDDPEMNQAIHDFLDEDDQYRDAPLDNFLLWWCICASVLIFTAIAAGIWLEVFVW